MYQFGEIRHTLPVILWTCGTRDHNCASRATSGAFAVGVRVHPTVIVAVGVRVEEV